MKVTGIGRVPPVAPVHRVVFTRARLPELRRADTTRSYKGICLIVSDGPEASQLMAWLSQAWPHIEQIFREKMAGLMAPTPPGKKELVELRRALEEAIREVDAQLKDL